MSDRVRGLRGSARSAAGLLGSVAGFAGCSITLDEYDQCQTESAAAWDALVSRLDCEDYTPQLLRDTADIEDSPACQAIEAKCPGVLEAAVGSA